MIMTLESAGVDPGGCGHALVNPRNPTADRVRRGAWGRTDGRGRRPRCACRTRGKGGSGASPWHPGERKPYGWQSPVPAHGPARGGACCVRSSAARCREGGSDRTVRKLRETGPSGNRERSPEGGAVRGVGCGVRPQDCACGGKKAAAELRGEEFRGEDRAEAEAHGRSRPRGPLHQPCRPRLRPGRRGMRHGYRQKCAVRRSGIPGGGRHINCSAP